MKRDRAQRAETNLAVQQEVFERALASLINGLKYVDGKFLESLKSAQIEADTERKKELQHLQKSLLAIVMVIKKLKCNTKNEQFVQDHEPEYFKQHMITIEENLTSFKNLLCEQLENLQEEDVALQQSIESLSRRLHETSTASAKQLQSLPSNTIKQRVKSRVRSQLQENIHPDIKEFNEFIRSNGGHTGGWDTNDHLLFTRFLQKYRDSEQLTNALLDFMPEKSPEEIAQHETWYHEYLTLKEAQRKALKEWKEETLQKQKGDLRGKDSVSTDSTSSTVQRLPNQRDPSIKEKILKWKEMQETKRQQELQELYIKKKKEEESWRRKVAYFEQQRQIMAERRAELLKMSPNSECQIAESGRSASRKHIPLKDFWEQDKQYLERRQSRLQRLSASPKHTRTRSHSTVNVERDPARLLQLTAVWRARMRRSLSQDGNSDTKSHRGSLYIADVPHLGIPKWRAGLV